MGRVRVGVTGTGSLIGQAIIKSIKASDLKNSISIIGFDYAKETIGSYWVNEFFLLPDFLKNGVTEESWLNKIIDILKKEHTDFLFIGIDFELPLFAKYKNIIEADSKCKIVISDDEVIKICDDKYLTYKFLKDNNFSYPKTLLAEKFSGADIKFPCIVKPRQESGSKGVQLVNNRKEAKSALLGKDNYIIQELIGESSREYTCGVIFFDGEVKNSIVLKRELKYGNTIAASFSFQAPKAIDECVRAVAGKLKPFGACNFQLRLDNYNVPKIFEINARHSGTTYMRFLFGFREVEYILNYLLGEKVKKSKLKEGTVKRYYEELFVK